MYQPHFSRDNSIRYGSKLYLGRVWTFCAGALLVGPAAASQPMAGCIGSGVIEPVRTNEESLFTPRLAARNFSEIRLVRLCDLHVFNCRNYALGLRNDGTVTFQFWTPWTDPEVKNCRAGNVKASVAAKFLRRFKAFPPLPPRIGLVSRERGNSMQLIFVQGRKGQPPTEMSIDFADAVEHDDLTPPTKEQQDRADLIEQLVGEKYPARSDPIDRTKVKDVSAFLKESDLWRFQHDLVGATGAQSWIAGTRR